MVPPPPTIKILEDLVRGTSTGGLRSGGKLEEVEPGGGKGKGALVVMLETGGNGAEVSAEEEEGEKKLARLVKQLEGGEDMVMVASRAERRVSSSRASRWAPVDLGRLRWSASLIPV